MTNKNTTVPSTSMSRKPGRPKNTILHTFKSNTTSSLSTERCGPVLGGGTGPEPEPPQPLVTREPSVSLLRWDRGPATTPTVPTTDHRHRRTEPVSLATLQKDCFVIPAHALDRFLPDGVPVSIFFFFLFLDWLSFVGGQVDRGVIGALGHTYTHQ